MPPHPPRSRDLLAVAIGTAVRGAAARRDVKHPALASRLNISANSLSRRVNGHLPFTWPELVRVSEILDIDLSEIIADAEIFAAKAAVAADADAQACEIEGAA